MELGAVAGIAVVAGMVLVPVIGLGLVIGIIAVVAPGLVVIGLVMGWEVAGIGVPMVPLVGVMP
jgi:hypothetical protein